MQQEHTPAEETQEVSVEDRVAGLFGDQVEQSEPTQAAPEAPAETAEETFEFEHEGAKYQLPKKLEKAVLQGKDYTQKTQSLAEMRKDVERQFAQIKLAQTESQFRQQIAPDEQQIAVIDAVIEEYKKLDWSKMTTDEMVRKKLESDQYRDMREALQNSIKAKRAQFDQAYQQELAKIKGEAAETLKKRINWSDETETEVRSYVRELGITDAEYDGVYDPRHKQILWEASQYRKLKAGAQPAAQQVRAVKTTSSNPMPQQVKEKLNFNKAIAKTAVNSPERRKLIEGRAASLFS